MALASAKNIALQAFNSTIDGNASKGSQVGTICWKFVQQKAPYYSRYFNGGSKVMVPVLEEMACKNTWVSPGCLFHPYGVMKPLLVTSFFGPTCFKAQILGVDASCSRSLGFLRLSPENRCINSYSYYIARIYLGQFQLHNYGTTDKDMFVYFRVLPFRAKVTIRVNSNPSHCYREEPWEEPTQKLPFFSGKVV